MISQTLLHWTGKDERERFLYWDVTLSETAEHNNEVTQFPVEKGADISDHVRPQPDKVTLEILVSGTPLADLPDGSRNMQARAISLSLPKPQTGILGVIRNPVAAIMPPQQIKAQTYGFREGDYVGETERAIHELWENHYLVSIVGPVRDFKDMVLTRYTVPRDKDFSGGTAKFSLEFTSIRFANTQIVTAPVPTESRGFPKVDKGKLDPTDATKKLGDKESVAHDAVGDALNRFLNDKSHSLSSLFGG